MDDFSLNIWKFIRGDLDNSEFESLIYNKKSLKEYFGEDFYLEIISNDYRNKDQIYKLKEKLKQFQRENYPQKCKCIELKDLSVVDMGEESGLVFTTFKKIIDRGKPFWWLYLSKCDSCNQNWLVAQEERQNDLFCMLRLNEEEVNQILNKNNWPKIFDRYETLLLLGKEFGRTFRFYDPINSMSLADTIHDLAIEKPYIKLTYLSSLLNLEIDTAYIICKNVMKNTGVKIDLSL